MATSRILRLKAKDWMICGCLDFIKDPTDLADAVRRSVETFILAMQSQGRIPKRSQDEIDEILATEVDTLDIDVSGVDEYVDQTEEAARAARITELATQAGANIDRSATPQIRETVTLNENSPQAERPTTRISLFKQPRRSFADLKRESPKDRFIEEAVGYKEDSYEQRLFVAALEIVYSNLPKDIWGSDRAGEEITKMIKLHNGSEQ